MNVIYKLIYQLTMSNQKRKDAIQKYLDQYGKSAYSSENQYRVITKAIKDLFPSIVGDIENKKLYDVVFALSHMPRDWRDLTEVTRKKDKALNEKSTQLSEQWQINNGYVSNPNQSLFDNAIS